VTSPTATIATEAIPDHAHTSRGRAAAKAKSRRMVKTAAIAVASADLIGAAILAWRAVAWPGSAGLHPVLFVSRVALAGIFGAWALVYMTWSFFPGARLAAALVRTANKGASSFIVLWAAAAGAADILAGAEPVGLVGGLALASLYGWDNPLRTTIVATAAALLGAAVSLLRSRLGGLPLDLETLALIAVFAGSAAGTAYTIRSYVAPGRELLKELELENKQLWDLSFRDPLTGLYNRRFAQETGRNLFQRARRYHEQLYVLMMDVDRFKRINDELTHARGDEVLKAIAAIIQSCLRSSDSVSRYGGEEFLAYLVQADSQVAQFVANRIRDTIESTTFAGVPWQVTISIGVAGIQDDDVLEALIDRSDRYLYAAKRGGRNRVAGF
jgi:diguanylate cyclase (GGDEF)-like protein